MQLLDDGLIRPRSNTSPVMHWIFILKSSNLVYAVHSIKLFVVSWIQMWQNIVTGFLPDTKSVMMIMGNSIFIKKESLGKEQPKLKSNWPVHEIDTILHQLRNWCFKRYPAYFLNTINTVAMKLFSKMSFNILLN